MDGFRVTPGAFKDGGGLLLLFAISAPSEETLVDALVVGVGLESLVVSAIHRVSLPFFHKRPPGH